MKCIPICKIATTVGKARVLCYFVREVESGIFGLAYIEHGVVTSFIPWQEVIDRIKNSPFLDYALKDNTDK